MSNDPLSLQEIDERIAMTRENIREITEQATAISGAADEARNADRIAKQNEERDRLMRLREQLLQKK